jgi:hypothetical protein
MKIDKPGRVEKAASVDLHASGCGATAPVALIVSPAKARSVSRR